jgi:small subunit ribosomal protein S1
MIPAMPVFVQFRLLFGLFNGSFNIYEGCRAAVLYLFNPVTSGYGLSESRDMILKEHCYMSKELIRTSQYRTSKAKVTAVEDMVLEAGTETVSDLSALYEGIFKNFQPGKTTTARVMRIDSDGVLVDLKYKSHGLIPKFEFGPHELKGLAVGDELEVLVDQLESPEGRVVVSYERAKAMRAWDRIVKLFETGEPVTGTVTHKVKGGLSVDIGIDAFLPGSQIDLQRVTDFDQYVGQRVTATILKINRKRGNVIISRRKYMSDQRADSRKKVLSDLQVGQIIQGIVKDRKSVV